MSSEYSIDTCDAYNLKPVARTTIREVIASVGVFQSKNIQIFMLS